MSEIVATPDQIESAVMTRLNTAVAEDAPGFDPTVLIDFLMTLATGLCGKTSPDPASAVKRVQGLNRIEQSALTGKFVNYCRTRGIPDAKRLAPAAVGAAVKVGKAATPEEQVAFAGYVMKVSHEDYNPFDQSL